MDLSSRNGLLLPSVSSGPYLWCPSIGVSTWAGWSAPGAAVISFVHIPSEILHGLRVLVVSTNTSDSYKSEQEINWSSSKSSLWTGSSGVSDSGHEILHKDTSRHWNLSVNLSSETYQCASKFNTLIDVKLSLSRVIAISDQMYKKSKCTKCIREFLLKKPTRVLLHLTVITSNCQIIHPADMSMLNVKFSRDKLPVCRHLLSSMAAWSRCPTQWLLLQYVSWGSYLRFPASISDKEISQHIKEVTY